jgi:hypothetical protein
MTELEMIQLQKEVEQLRQENEALKAPKKRAEPSVSFKISAKGAISVYGLGRYPVTLYEGQWTKLFAAAKDIATFINANQDKVAKKPVKVVTEDKQAA